MDHPYLSLLVDRTRAQAAAHRSEFAAGVPAGLPHRETMRAVKTLVLADLHDDGEHEATAALADALLTHLERAQGATGLFDGDNLISPPDSAFTINDVCLVVEVLDQEREGTRRWTPVAARLRAVAARSVEGLVTGGVHTPNHRWELAGALAGLHHVTGDDRLRPRALEWLAEAVDIDADGFYSERSGIYASIVSNQSLLTLARLLDLPDLLEPVRANLRTLPGLVDDDGEVVTVHSRRQDQRETFHVSHYLSQLRRFAVTDGDAQLARLARIAAAGDLPEPSRHLGEALVDPVVLGELPEPAAPAGFRAHWPTVGLVRRREGATTSTVFAGSDTRATGRIASGLSNSATVFQLRHGAARLHALRISPQFFDMGAFRPTSMRVAGDRVVLGEVRESGYYQPLPASHRRPDGAYPLSDDGRFFASMDFAARPSSTITLRTSLTLHLSGDGAALELAFEGPRTAVAVELVLGEGEIDGVRPHPTLPGTYWLRGGELELRSGEDRIAVRVDGHDESLVPEYDDGEAFGYVHGHDRIPGRRVLVAARTTDVLRIQVQGRNS